MKLIEPRKNRFTHRRFIDGSDARAIMSADERGVIGLSGAQNFQMKSQRSPRVITRGPRHSPPQASKSSTAQAQCPRAIGRNRRRAGNRQRQTAGKLVTFLTGIRGLVNANAILWQKLYARFSEHTFDQGNRVPVSRVATQLNVRDRVSTQTGCLSQVPNRPIERGPSDLVQLPRAQLTCDKVTTTFATSPNQGGIQ
jgi:hypothetical protein